MGITQYIASLIEMLFQVRARMGSFRLDQILRGACKNELPAALASLRPDIDYPIRTLDHIHVMLDDENTVALCYQSVKGLEQFLDVMEVQAGSWLVKDEKGPALIVPLNQK